MILGIDGCQAASHRSTCTGLYMNGSRCHEDMVVGVMKIWAVGHRRLTPSKFSFKGYLANEWGRCQRGCPVLMSLVSRGCAMQSRLSPARCRFARWSRRSGCRSRSSLNGVVPTRHVDRNKAMISSSGRVFLWYRLWLMMVPVD